MNVTIIRMLLLPHAANQSRKHASKKYSRRATAFSSGKGVPFDRVSTSNEHDHTHLGKSWDDNESSSFSPSFNSISLNNISFSSFKTNDGVSKSNRRRSSRLLSFHKHDGSLNRILTTDPLTELPTAEEEVYLFSVNISWRARYI